MEFQTPRQIADSYNRLAKAAQKDDALKMLQPLAIRTMSKAVYTTENIGHYGLGFDHYSHFTSPIRRYSDVLTHRILEKNLTETVRVKKALLEEKCVHISAQERKAMTAERESIKYKQVEFIMDHVGEVFEGRISGMIDRGLFVELVESRCEGMVAFDTLYDNFEVAESRLRAVGRRTKEVFKMGQIIQVKVLSADLERREIEMELMEED
jgi:ribonuclease R